MNRARWISALAAAVVLLALCCGVGRQVQTSLGLASGSKRDRPIPVELAAIQRGAISVVRTFSGTLEASARLIVAPRVGGRIERLDVDLGDVVTRGQIVGELENAEPAQVVGGARAELAVARADLSAAGDAAKLAARELTRIEGLHAGGAVSSTDLERARAAASAAQARRDATRAQVQRAGAALEGSRIRFGYMSLAADWAGPGEERVVAERHVREGDTIGAGDPVLTLVELDPLVGVVYVTEKEYSRMVPGLPAQIHADAHAGAAFEGRVEHVAPVFSERSRQARVELTVPNPDQVLKPGMFVQASVVLDHLDVATLVPSEAVTRRDDRDGVFVLDAEGGSVRWEPVTTGLMDGKRTQILEELKGFVVVMGQQSVKDGSRVTLPDGVPAE